MSWRWEYPHDPCAVFDLEQARPCTVGDGRYAAPMIRRRGSIVVSVAGICAVLLTAGCSATVEGEATAADTATPSRTPTTEATTSAPATTTTTTTASPVDPDSFAGDTAGVYYFSSASGKFGCAILVHTDPLAGCQGDMPPDTPLVPGSGAPDVRVPANAVLLGPDTPGEWVNIGSIEFMDLSGAPRPLPYGQKLVVDPFTCTIDETTGVTCETGEHGFTVSDTDYEVW